MKDTEIQGYQPRQPRRRWFSRSRQTLWNTSQRNANTVDAMSASSFILLVTLFTLLGIGFAIFTGSFSYGWSLTSWSSGLRTMFFMALVLTTVSGTGLYIKSDRWYFSALGYALVAGPFGFALGPVVSQYTPDSVVQVSLMTVLYTVFFGIIGAIIPVSLEHWSGTLYVALIAIILAYVGLYIAGGFGFDISSSLHLLEIIVIGVFGLVIAFNMNHTMGVPRTLDKAIDCAGALFTSMLNVFTNLLPLAGQRN